MLKSTSMLLLFAVLFLAANYQITCKTIKPDDGRSVVVVAHRGASGYLPEHTLEAKALAFFMQSDYLEQDLVLSKDDVPIVLHDIYLDDVTDVATKFDATRGRKVGNVTKYYAIDFTFEEIKTLKATERFKTPNQTQVYPSRFPLWESSFQLNSFEEEIQLIMGMYKSFKSVYDKNDNQIDIRKVKMPGLYVELKRPEFHKQKKKTNFSEIVLNVLAKYKLSSEHDDSERPKVIIQCFDPIELKRIRTELKSNLTLVQLLEAKSEPNLEGLPTIDYNEWNSLEGLTKIKEFANGIGPEKDQVIVVGQDKSIKPSNLTENAKKLGLFIHPYTFRIDSLPTYVSSYSELLDLFLNKIRVDGLFTDFPDLTSRFVETKLKSNAPRLVKSSLGVLILAMMTSGLLRLNFF